MDEPCTFTHRLLSREGIGRDADPQDAMHRRSLVTLILGPVGRVRLAASVALLAPISISGWQPLQDETEVRLIAAFRGADIWTYPQLGERSHHGRPGA